MKKIISIIILILITAGLSACGNQLTDELVREIAENESSLAGMNTSALHIEAVVEFDNQIKDLPNSENNKLVLLSDGIDNRFSIVAVDIENEKLNIWSTGYKPLNVLLEYILTKENTEANIANFNLVADYIKKYGFNCFIEQSGQEERFKYAEEYIRELTGTGGVLNTEVARGILDKTLPSYMFPNVNSEVAILYENGNANPLYYAQKSSEMVYNWSFFDEGTYNVWKATTDRQTQNTMIALYGQPYVPKTVWVVVDKYCEDEVGTFNSLEAAKKKLIPTSAPAQTETSTTKHDSQESSSQQKKVLTVAVAEEYPPFEYYENGELVGFDIDLINHIADRLGYKIEFSQMQFDALLMAVNAGKVDCAISGIIATPEKENAVNFTSPYITTKMDSEGTETETYSIALNPNDNELLSEMNKIISEAQNDGTIQTLIEKYNIQT